MAVIEYLIFLLVGSAFTEGAKLPSYILPCSLSDPTLNECAAKHGQEALPTLVKGDNKYKIPSMVPLKIPEIKFSSGDLNIKLNNVKIFGFEDTQIKDFKIDTQKRHMIVTVAIARANLLSDYDISGKILILPMNGQGPANITFINGIYNYQFDYDLKEKNGEDYLHLTNTNLEYTTTRSHYYFENLFGGDQALGSQVNQFLDENWKEVEKDIGPALSETIDKIITATLTGIFSKVPYNDIFLP